MAKEKKNKEIFKVILIFIVVFILIPLLVLALLYFGNATYKKSINEFFRNKPGIVGEYFSKYPTETEKADKELFLAEYYLSISEESAADKLYIIKKDDEELYNSVIKRMNSNLSGKTKNIIKLIRNIELRKDLLFTLYEEINAEQDIALNEEVKRLETLELSLAIRETESMVEQVNSGERLGKIFSRMKEKKAVEVLYHVQPDVKNIVISNIESKKRKEIQSLLNQQDNRNDELRMASEVYEAMDMEKASLEIGNVGKYKIEDLSKIYMDLSIKKASEILINSDEEFINKLITNLAVQERLSGEEDSRAVKIMETMNYYEQYKKRIAELVILYEKMEAVDITKIVEKMIVNKNDVTVFEIDESPIYNTSDSSIILDVLKGMKKQKMSQVLSNMDPKKAAEITRQLATQ